jgi:cytochrome c5
LVWPPSQTKLRCRHRPNQSFPWYVLSTEEHQMKRVFLVAVTVAALLAAGQVAAADGKAVYEKSCKGCHAAMKPKTGDKEAWVPLIKQGADALTASVIKGKGVMPPKGTAASDADVKAAVEYMLSQSK